MNCSSIVFDSLSTIGGSLICLINNQIIPILITLAVLFFIWGIMQTFIIPGSASAKAQGRQYAIWGLLGLFIILSIWGIIGVLQNTFQIGGGGTIQSPQFNVTSG